MNSFLDMKNFLSGEVPIRLKVRKLASGEREEGSIQIEQW